MFQITAIYQGCEVSYVEGYNLSDTLMEVMEELESGMYSEAMDDITYSIIGPEGSKLEM